MRNCAFRISRYDVDMSPEPFINLDAVYPPRYVLVDGQFVKVRPIIEGEGPSGKYIKLNPAWEDAPYERREVKCSREKRR